MTLALLKSTNDEHAQDEATHRETGDDSVRPVVATDPRPRPANHARHLDVNKVLERSLPRVEDASRKFSRD